MSKYLKLFETHSEYETYIEGQNVVLPNVSYCEDNNEVYYNPWVETRLIAKFNVTSISSATSILDSRATSLFSEIEIDGVVLPNVVNSYTFSTTGEHIIKYTLINNTSIGNYTFCNCKGLTSIIIPNSITAIGMSAFYQCSALTSVSIPDSVTSIGDGAFVYCSRLTSVTIPNSVTSINTNTFASCRGLTSIIIPDSVTSIGQNSFTSCSNLTSITIPNSVTSIGNEAFKDCTSLTSVTIDNSVVSIGTNAFQNCRSLISIKVENGNTTYDSRNDCNAIIETASNTLIAGCKNTVIPNSVTSIGLGAFQGCSGLTTVTIPNSVTSIGAWAFYNCSGLASIICNATTGPTIQNVTFRNIKTGGTLTVPTGSTGYDTWMGTGNYYLGLYNWTKVEQ